MTIKRITAVEKVVQNNEREGKRSSIAYYNRRNWLLGNKINILLLIIAAATSRALVTIQIQT